MSVQRARQLLLVGVLLAFLVAQAAGQSCTRVSGTSGGDFAVGALVTRQPVLNVNFTSSPTCATGVASNWQWAASDPLDSTSIAALHQGVAILNGSASQWIDMTTASGPQSAGAVLPLFGGRGFDGSGWSIEMVVKFPSTTTNVGNGACLFLFQDAADDWTTIVWDSTYDRGDTDSGNRLTANQYSNQTATGLPTAALGATIEFFAPNNASWYHITWVMAPSPSLAAGTAVWSLYINGRLLNYAAALVPSSTLTPIQGANMPPGTVRTIASLAKDSYADTMVVNIDAFRVYDYLLPAATVASLANAYGLLDPVSTPPTSYTYPSTTETTRLASLVPTPPIFNANFAVNPTTNPAIPTTAYQWAAADPSDTPAMQALHPGVILLNGNASSFINLQQASGPNSCGLVVPIIGTQGSGTGAQQGLSFEMVFKYPAGYAIRQSSKLFDLGQGGTETIDMAAQTSGSLQLEQQNNVQPGLESSAYQSTYTAQGSFSAVGVWNHVVWVLSSPNFSNYSATWTLYVNGTVMPFITAYSGLYPLPVYRPLSYIGGSDYWDANTPLTVDAFRIYDYALQATTISTLYNTLYNPAGHSSSGGGGGGSGSTGGSGGGGGAPGVCTRVSGTSGGDFAVGALVTRQPVLNVNFTSSPTCATGVASNWQWAASDPLDSTSIAALHQGVAILNGSASQWIDMTTASGPQSAGAVLPLFGGRGFDGSGWSIEMVVKFPSTTTNVGNGACLFLFQDAADDWTTIVWDSTYDRGDTDSGNRLTANQYSNQTATGLPTAALGATIEFFAPNNASWYHITWVMAPSPSLAAGTAVWSLYINGRLLNYAAALVPSSTLTPIQGANMPPGTVRTIASLAKDSYADTMVVNIDAFRVYDYLLPAATVASLANAYGLLDPVSTPPTSYTYPSTTETTRLASLVPTPPIFNANFAVNPTTNPAIPTTAYQWAAADPSDTPAMQALHPGVILLNGNASSFINLQQASGPNSCGLVVPIIGTQGSGTGAQQGLSFEMVFKYPAGYAIRQSSKLFDLGQGGTETIDMAAQTSGSLQLEQQNNVQPGLESSAYQSTYTAQGSFSAVGVWNHVVWVLSSPNFSNYSATWTLYVNGTVMPFITAYSGLYPLPVYRPLSYIGGSDYWDANTPLTVDAFRIYDYALQATTISTLYNTLYRPGTAQVASSSSSAAARASSSSSSSTAAVGTSTAAAAGVSSSSSSGAANNLSGGSSSSSLSGGAIAGIVIGSVVGAALLFCIAALFLCRGGKRRGDKQLDERNTAGRTDGEHSVVDTDHSADSEGEVEMTDGHHA